MAHDYYDRPMTEAQARFVRRCRIDQHATWRGVASECNRAWGGDWGSNQLVGMSICARAAELLGEDPETEPWN